MSIREPIVAGKFYPEEREDLVKVMDNIYGKEKKSIKVELSKKEIIGGIVPHAGYAYSGYQATHFFDIVGKSEEYDTVIIINPNHTGYGSELEADSNNIWRTPFGDVVVDLEFRDSLNITVSDEAQKFEHSGEVMLPFLQRYLNYKFKIVPICIGRQNFENSRYLAKEIYRVKNELGRKILIIASSDFSHFLSAKEGRELDQYVVDAILSMDSKRVEREVVDKKISVCGFGAIMTLMEYSKFLNSGNEIEILKRGHSGEVVDSYEVVDYISMLFYK